MQRRSTSVGKLAVVLVVGVALLPLVTGCDLIDQILDLISPGGGSAGSPQAVMTAVVDDDLVDMGLNPDHRPPIWYQFSCDGSLNSEGISIFDPMAGLHDKAWDYGDGTTRGFEWSDTNPTHIYREEGTYVASLTIRDAATGATDTVQQTITIGPGWLEIVSLTTEPWLDGSGRATLNVVVRNQSQQDLRVVVVDLLVDGVFWRSNVGVTLGPGSTPERLSPNATYTITEVISDWTGTLTARSGFCTPWATGP